ncbi:hypothetical protein ABDD95_07655 [Mucilaginibacter sp. PAMB04274]|uniref:hypothetical protein n=1 Tax=Mucilaginibacter sp. PAMB04274 TaxID=3138568 RepID=UPI0031F63875
MKTITLNLYRFNELDKTAQEKALTTYRHVNIELDWWETEYEDFTTLCTYLGMAVDPSSIRFSGFDSPGDGSAFSAGVNLPKLCKAIPEQAWKAYAPLQTFPFCLPDADRRLMALITEGILTINPQIIGGHSSYGVFTDLIVQMPGDKGREHGNIRAELLKLEDWLQQVAETLNRYLYGTLEKQYEYLTSDTAVGESIGSDEYLFTADGHPAGHLLALSQDQSHLK